MTNTNINPIKLNYSSNFSTSANTSWLHNTESKNIRELTKHVMSVAEGETFAGDSWTWHIDEVTDKGTEPLFRGSGWKSLSGEHVHDKGVIDVKTSLRVSKKMLASIARMEKKYGLLNKDFFVEHDECNRRGGNWADGCILTCNILQDLHIAVAFDGKIS
jgi:hypothetical protein